MRIPASLLILSSAVMQVVLAVLLLLASGYERFDARTEAGDLSSVAGDLVDEAELARMQKDADSRVGAAGARPLALGAGLLAVALLELAGGVLVALGRARLLAGIAAGAGIAALGAVLLLDGYSHAGIIAAGLAAGGLACLPLLRRPLPATTAAAPMEPSQRS